MGLVAEVMARFRADTSDLEAGAARAADVISHVGDGTETIGNGFSAAGERARSFSDEVSRGSQTLGGLANSVEGVKEGFKHLVETAGVSLSIGAIVDTAKNYTEQIQQFGVEFKAAFGSNEAGNAALKQASSFADQYGVSLGSAASAMDQFQLAMKGSGVGQAQLNGIMKDAQDIAAGTGQSIDAVAGSLSNYYNLVQRSGTASAGRAATPLLSEHIIDPNTYNEIRIAASQGDNANQLLDMILKNAEKTYSGSGEALSKTLGGQLQTFRNLFEKGVGGLLGPVMGTGGDNPTGVTAFLADINKALQAPQFTEFASKAAAGLEPVGKLFSEAGKSVEGFIQKLSTPAGMQSFKSEFAWVGNVVTDIEKIGTAAIHVVGQLISFGEGAAKAGAPFIAFAQLLVHVAGDIAAFAAHSGIAVHAIEAIGIAFVAIKVGSWIETAVTGMRTLAERFMAGGAAVQTYDSWMSKSTSTVSGETAAMMQLTMAVGKMTELMDAQLRMVQELTDAYLALGMAERSATGGALAATETSSFTNEAAVARMRGTTLIPRTVPPVAEPTPSGLLDAKGNPLASTTIPNEAGLVTDAAVVGSTRTSPTLLAQTKETATGLLRDPMMAGIMGIVAGQAAFAGAQHFQQNSAPQQAFNTGGDVLTGAGTGAMLGSVIPGLGTGVGAGIGAAVGGLVGLFHILGSASTEAAQALQKFQESTDKAAQTFLNAHPIGDTATSINQSVVTSGLAAAAVSHNGEVTAYRARIPQQEDTTRMRTQAIYLAQQDDAGTKVSAAKFNEQVNQIMAHWEKSFGALPLIANPVHETHAQTVLAGVTEAHQEAVKAQRNMNNNVGFLQEQVPGLSRQAAIAAEQQAGVNLGDRSAQTTQQIQSLATSIQNAGGAAQVTAEQISSAVSSMGDIVTGASGNSSFSMQRQLQERAGALGIPGPDGGQILGGMIYNSIDPKMMAAYGFKDAKSFTTDTGQTPAMTQALNSELQMTQQVRDATQGLVQAQHGVTEATWGEVDAAFALKQAGWAVTQAQWGEVQATFGMQQAQFSQTRANTELGFSQTTLASATTATATAFSTQFLPVFYDFPTTLAQLQDPMAHTSSAVLDMANSFSTQIPVLQQLSTTMNTLTLASNAANNALTVMQQNLKVQQDVTNSPLVGTREQQAQEAALQGKIAGYQAQEYQLQAQNVPTNSIEYKDLQSAVLELTSQFNALQAAGKAGPGDIPSLDPTSLIAGIKAIYSQAPGAISQANAAANQTGGIQYQQQQVQIAAMPTKETSYGTELQAAAAESGIQNLITGVGGLQQKADAIQPSLTQATYDFNLLNNQMTAENTGLQAIAGTNQTIISQANGILTANNAVIQAGHAVETAGQQYQSAIHSQVDAGNAVQQAGWQAEAAHVQFLDAQSAIQQANNSLASFNQQNIAQIFAQFTQSVSDGLNPIGQTINTWIANLAATTQDILKDTQAINKIESGPAMQIAPSAAAYDIASLQNSIAQMTATGQPIDPSKNAFAFAEGGYTGNTARLPGGFAGYVHPGEFVLSASMLQQISNQQIPGLLDKTSTSIPSLVELLQQAFDMSPSPVLTQQQNAILAGTTQTQPKAPGVSPVTTAATGSAVQAAVQAIGQSHAGQSSLQSAVQSAGGFGQPMQSSLATAVGNAGGFGQTMQIPGTTLTSPITQVIPGTLSTSGLSTSPGFLPDPSHPVSTPAPGVLPAWDFNTLSAQFGGAFPSSVNELGQTTKLLSLTPPALQQPLTTTQPVYLPPNLPPAFSWATSSSFSSPSPSSVGSGISTAVQAITSSHATALDATRTDTLQSNALRASLDAAMLRWAALSGQNVPTTSPAPTGQSVQDLQAVINTLTAQLQALTAAGAAQGNTVSLASLPPFLDGGPVPGAPGSPVPILAHGGEFVLSQTMLNTIAANSSMIPGNTASSVTATSFDPRQLLSAQLDELRALKAPSAWQGLSDMQMHSHMASMTAALASPRISNTGHTLTVAPNAVNIQVTSSGPDSAAQIGSEVASQVGQAMNRVLQGILDNTR